jgi:hypothetical protein
MMVSINSIEYGVYVILQTDKPLIKENRRRLSRSATMDGGCVITDSGISNGDRTISFTAPNVERAVSDLLWSIFEDNSMVMLSTAEGVFSGYMESVSIDGTSVEISFMVYEKLT